VTISWALVRYPVYTIVMRYAGEVGFHWGGEVDSDGVVTESEFELTK
jgi:hypothetical protein